MLRLSVLLFFPAVFSWDLRPFVSPNAVISDVIVWKNKAFLCVPRQDANASVTLLVSTWPEAGSDVTRFTPNALPFPSLDLQTTGEKSNILSAVSGDVDFKGLLFILDVGRGLFHPKIIVFNLIKWQKMMTRVVLEGAPHSLSSLVVDPFSVAPMVYVADSANQRIIVYDHKAHKWWPVNLHMQNIFTGQFIRSTNLCSTLAVSKIHPTLFLTSEESSHLYSLDLTVIDSLLPVHDYNNISMQDCNITMKIEGEKLGRSVGLAADSAGGIHYYLPRFFAAVRWDSRFTLMAESHTVTLQSQTRLPGATSIFVDPHKQVWIVLKKKNGMSRSGATTFCLKLQDYMMRPCNEC